MGLSVHSDVAVPFSKVAQELRYNKPRGLSIAVGLSLAAVFGKSLVYPAFRLSDDTQQRFLLLHRTGLIRDAVDPVDDTATTLFEPIAPPYTFPAVLSALSPVCKEGLEFYSI